MEIQEIDEVKEWKVVLPDSKNTTATFSGKPSVKLASIGTGVPIEYTINIRVSSATDWSRDE